MPKKLFISSVYQSTGDGGSRLPLEKRSEFPLGLGAERETGQHRQACFTGEKREGWFRDVL